VLAEMIGLVRARYVLRVEPLASAPPESLVAAVDPTVQRYLTGDVELPVRPATGQTGQAASWS
jgi:hypothetical protein